LFRHGRSRPSRRCHQLASSIRSTARKMPRPGPDYLGIWGLQSVHCGEKPKKHITVGVINLHKNAFRRIGCIVCHSEAAALTMGNGCSPGQTPRRILRVCILDLGTSRPGPAASSLWPSSSDARCRSPGEDDYIWKGSNLEKSSTDLAPKTRPEPNKILYRASILGLHKSLN